MPKETVPENHEVRIKNVPDKIYQDLMNIAQNSNMSLPNILRVKLIDIANSYPAEFKQPPSIKK